MSCRGWILLIFSSNPREIAPSAHGNYCHVHVTKQEPTGSSAKWLTSSGWLDVWIIQHSSLTIVVPNTPVVHIALIMCYRSRTGRRFVSLQRPKRAVFAARPTLPYPAKTNVTHNPARNQTLHIRLNRSKTQTCSTPLILYQHSDMIRLYCTSYRHISPALLPSFMLTCSMPSHLPNTGKSKTESVIRNILKSTTSFVCLREMGNLWY